MTPEQFRRRLMENTFNVDCGYATITTLSDSNAGTLNICGDDFNLSQIASVTLNGTSVAVARTISVPAGQSTVRINYRGLTSAKDMFANVAKNYNDNTRQVVVLDISNLNTSFVKDASSMFEEGYFKNIVGIGAIDVSKVTSMYHLFWNAVFYNQDELNLSEWNVSKVSNFNYAFGLLIGITKINLTGWDTSQATDMSYMFADIHSPFNEVIMTGPTNPNAIVTSLFRNAHSTGTFKYNNSYNYSHIIGQLPSGWIKQAI